MFLDMHIQLLPGQRYHFTLVGTRDGRPRTLGLMGDQRLGDVRFGAVATGDESLVAVVDPVLGLEETERWSLAGQ